MKMVYSSKLKHFSPNRKLIEVVWETLLGKYHSSSPLKGATHGLNGARAWRGL